MIKKIDKPVKNSTSSNSEQINVGIGEYRVARSPCRLKTVLGSCVGVLVYDLLEKIGGLAHIYLPYAAEFNSCPLLASTGNRYSFADELIPRMLDDLLAMKGNRSRFTSYITGGGYLLKDNYMDQMDIGKRNLLAARSILKQEQLLFRELSVGQRFGQTVIFNLFDGGVEVQVHE